MDRRTVLTSMAGAVAGSACTARDDSEAERTGRPTLAIESQGAGRWRIRSWQWQENAWRPLMARARQGDAGLEINGQIDAADRAEVLARLRA